MNVYICHRAHKDLLNLNYQCSQSIQNNQTKIFHMLDCLYLYNCHSLNKDNQTCFNVVELLNVLRSLDFVYGNESMTA